MRRINHFVVLMLENRSFDNLLGRLYPAGPEFDGLTGTESNPLHESDGSVREIGVWTDRDLAPEAACMPDPDPGELFRDINMQLFGLHGRPGGRPSMDGFVDNYARQKTTEKAPDPRSIMHVFSPDHVPVLSELARSFGVSDRWFASAPCQTWPNRLFTHTGTAAGRVDNNMIPLPFFTRSIFRRLERRGHDWRVYFHDIPQTAALCDLWTRLPTHFRLFEKEFARDADEGRLPAYSFIEPRYFASVFTGKMPNDAHPPHNLVYSEQLIAATYNALRAGRAWDRTLFVVTYDEHGGCYDHAPPPDAVPPGPPYPDGFRFDRYGPRVPAVIASPWLAHGSIVRPPEGAPPFDHTSLLATLHRLFDLGPPPNPRVASAPDLLDVLTLERPENRGPERLEVSDTVPGREALARLKRLPRNSHQSRLRHPAVLLPGLVAKGFGHAHGASWRRGRRH